MSVLIRYQDNSRFEFKSFSYGENDFYEKQMYNLRYQVYCLEKGFLKASDYPDYLETDDYNPCSRYVAAFSRTGIMVGCIRMIRVPAGRTFPFQKHCNALFPDFSMPDNAVCVEISRAMVSKEYLRRKDDSLWRFLTSLSSAKTSEDKRNIEDRRNAEPRQTGDGAAERARLFPGDQRQYRDIFVGIIREVYRQSKKDKIEYWVGAMEKSLGRLLGSLCFCFDPIGNEVDYYGAVTPYITSISKLDESLKRGNPKLFDWFQQET